MARRQPRQCGLLDTDRELVDVLREVNELRRSRALPEFAPATTNFRVAPRRPSARHALRHRHA